MKILVARQAGFCMGVRRALEMVLDWARRETKEIITYGPLIHNPQVVSILDSRNVVSTRDITRIAPDKLVFVSAHGISPEVRKRLRSTGARICDASCPDVLKVQGIIRKHARQGYSTVIFGDRGHSEVEGLLGFTAGKGSVISSPAEVDNLPPHGRFILVSQTTQGLDDYAEVARAVRKRYPAALIFSTICSSTRHRQEELKQIARKVDALVVVGGKNSANTLRLARIARRQGIPVFRVETAEELDPEEVGKYRKVGVAGGASTPNWLIQGVVDYLREWNWKRKTTWLRWLYPVFMLLVKLNIFIALGAASLTYTSFRLMNLPVRPVALLLSFSFALAIYTFNLIASRPDIPLRAPSRYRFYSEHRKTMPVLAFGGLFLGLGASALLGIKIFIIGIVICLFGFAYLYPFLPLPFSRRRLKDAPGCKEIVTSVFWAVIAALVPALSARPPQSELNRVGVVFLFVFIVIFVRSTLFDIRDAQGDRLMGRETIPVLLGKDKTKYFLVLLIVLLAALLVMAASRGWVEPLGFYLLLPLAYAAGYLFLYHRRIIFQGLFPEMIVDAQLILIGLIAWLF